MRDFRFHVASLIAVFLALGVGIFVGYGVALSIGMDPLRSQINAIRNQIAAVKQENKDLHQENEELQTQRQHLQNEMGRLAGLSVTGRLSGRTVSLVCVGPPPSQALVDSIWNILLLAGARRLSESVIRGSLLPPTPRGQQEILAKIQTLLPPSPAGTSQNNSNVDPTDTITAAVARAIGQGSDPSLLAALSHRRVPVDFSGSYNQRPDLVVLLSRVDSQSRLDALVRGETPETALVAAFQAQGHRVVECEPGTEPRTASSYFRRLGLSTIDDVDTTEGQVSLVWACLGYSGHFGTRPGADSFLPGLPITDQPPKL